MDKHNAHCPSQRMRMLHGYQYYVTASLKEMRSDLVRRRCHKVLRATEMSIDGHRGTMRRVSMLILNNMLHA